MKKITIVVTDSSLKNIIGKEVELDLDDNTNFIHVLKQISIRTEDKFPNEDYPEYHSLLHMVWNPIEKRIYKQIAVPAYHGNRKFFDIGKTPYDMLPEGLTIYLGLGLCKSEWEEVVDYETFKKAMAK